VAARVVTMDHSPETTARAGGLVPVPVAGTAMVKTRRVPGRGIQGAGEGGCAMIRSHAIQVGDARLYSSGMVAAA